jgi:hypothetical protein
MPRRSLHNPEFDDRPAFGLRDDALDEQLRAETASREQREQLQEERKRRRRVARPEDVKDADDTHDFDDFNDFNEFDDVDDRAKGYYAARTYHDWRASNRITSTEVAAILGAELLRWPKVTSDVKAFLFGRELTREHECFDVEEFLVEKLGFLPKARRRSEWVGNYSLPGIRHKLVLGFDTRGPRVVVNVRGRRRLTVYFSGGRIKSDGKSEPGMLRELSARALKSRQGCRFTSTVRDAWGVCVPRSEHFRKAIAAEQAKPRDFLEFEPIYLMVERVSATVIGLEEAYAVDD